MKRGRDLSWLKDWRFAGLAGILAGFLIGLLVFGEPWHLKPDWGDLPTWLLFAIALPGLYQLRVFVMNNAEEARRNVKRDDLLDRQLTEAQLRADADRRKQAEDIELTYYEHNGSAYGLIANNSRRPISDITCRVIRKLDGATLDSPDICGEVTVKEVSLASSPGGVPLPTWNNEQPGSRYGTLRPTKKCRFTFSDVTDGDPGKFIVAWFTDDAETRWHLDQFMHLADTKGDEYKP